MFTRKPTSSSSQGPSVSASNGAARPSNPTATSATAAVACPICGKQVRDVHINAHLDASCQTHIVGEDGTAAAGDGAEWLASQAGSQGATAAAAATPSQKRSASNFFQTPATKRQQATSHAAPPSNAAGRTAGRNLFSSSQENDPAKKSKGLVVGGGVKRSFDDGPGQTSPTAMTGVGDDSDDNGRAPTQPQQPSHPTKRSRTARAAPLAERMRPQSLDDICGQELVGPNGVLRSVIETDRVPSMILWGGSGTGKTTIARCIAQRVGSRFVEMNATNSGGVAECKKLFQEAANELALTGRKTILFCDEIHRFTKAQQDVFLRPVENGTITLIGATTENPSFRIVGALLSRCRTFTLAPLSTDDIRRILERAVQEETGMAVAGATTEEESDLLTASPPSGLSPLIDQEFLTYLAAFADGDARTALNLLELALSIAARPLPPTSSSSGPLTKDDLKLALTKTLVYDRAGDQHYDTISAFHKSVRGSDPDATLYYLARMLQSGEDPLFIARRMVVIASEDVGLADSSLLPLATAAYTAAQQIGMPEARIPLAHCAVALALAPKSTRAYRGLNNAFAALQEPGVAALPIPLHLRNAPTRLMKDLGYGKEYKYNPNYVNGRVKQDYLPEPLLGRSFLESRDLGTERDPELDD